MAFDAIDEALIALLSANARESTAELARKLNLSRSTVKDRVSRLERQGVIQGYGVKLAESYGEGHISAHVTIDVEPRASAQIVRQLGKIPAVKALYAVNGVHDLIAIIRTASTQALDQALDQIGAIDGIVRTVSSIVLSTKFER